MTTSASGPAFGSHPTHDRLLIAAHAADDLANRELERATALLAACADCRSLELELRAIALATHDLPAPLGLAGVDFRIHPDRAAALRRGRGWRRILRTFGRPGGSARPLALAFTTLGLAGLLLAALPTFPLGAGGAAMPASAPATSDGRNNAYTPTEPQPGATSELEAAAPFATADRALGDGTDLLTGGPSSGAGGGGGQYGANATPVPTSGTQVAGGAGASVVPTADDKSVVETVQLEGEPGGPSPLVMLSTGLLAAGLGLFVLRLVARRVS